MSHGAGQPGEGASRCNESCLPPQPWSSHSRCSPRAATTNRPTTGSGQDPVTIEITFEGGTVEPSGDRIEVAVDQPIELVVKADEGGEIHVHSTPEQEFEYSEGTTTLPLTIDKPGVVDVESHDLDQVIVQLEVE